MNILIAADGSDYTKRALAYLAAHDEWLGAAHRYTVLTVVPAVPPHAARVVGKEVLEGWYADAAEGVFKPIRAFFRKQKIEAVFVSKVGHAGEAIGKFADAGKFDLLVLGSHGHGTIGNLVMGSVATKVMASCRTPVLVVR
jgi:nucleotide-binding universal stress UspA family protein